jgi:hypothetical protein
MAMVKNLSVKQDGMLKDLVKKYLKGDNLTKVPKNPSSLDLLKRNDNAPECDRRKYLSLIISLMHLARFTRPDIMMPASYLSSKSAKPSVCHYSEAIRIIKYLSGTPNVGLVFTYNDGKVNVKVYADASHNLHENGCGHGGIFILLGSAPIFWCSTKLKCITRSSTESELPTLEDSVTHVIWLRQLLSDLGYAQDKPTWVYQDNTSTIIMAIRGGSFKRTKHMICKEAFIREKFRDGAIVLRCLPTNFMLADILTKSASSTNQLNLAKCHGIIAILIVKNWNNFIYVHFNRI